MDYNKLKEINEKGLELDKKIEELRNEYAALIEKPFVENDTEALNKILDIVTANCFSYYRYRIHTKFAELESERKNSTENN